ncbi:MAG: 2-hydroxyacyl-CoA dehydratase family protein [Proteobacteria bacterium]|nr:2-hydroxyacyl-CoA dehydratase family protein [Pseudomonadota bacterium]
MTRDLLTPFDEALAKNQERLRALSAQGRRIVGYFCTYTPVEVIHAAGFIPVRILGQSGPVTRADTLTPNFLCPYLRRALDRALAGEYDYLSGLVQGYTCDAACGMTGVWRETWPGRFYHTLPLPYNHGPDGRRFLAGALDDLVAKLDQAGGEFSDERLADSIELYGEIRRLTLGLDQARQSGQSRLSAADWLVVNLAGQVQPPEDHLNMLRDLVAADGPAEGPPGVPVLVSGSLIEEPRVMDLIESAGGRVVADDLCTGSRALSPPAGAGDSPLESLIDRYLNRAPCPARSRAEDRLAPLLETIKASGARGALFVFQKFCTPHLADHPTLAQGLKEAGCPSLALELEETGPSEGQLRTRLQAFFEMLD